MIIPFTIQAWIRYWLHAVDDHSLHAPFLFDFYTSVLKKSPDKSVFGPIEILRNKLLSDQRMLSYEDLGSPRKGSTVAEIARMSLTPQKFAALFYRIACFFDAKQILELGTSFGINTLYLAAKEDVTVHTFEGVREIADIAELTFEFAGASNIHLHFGKIESTLPGFMQQAKRVDMVFIDANHRYEPTIKYFSQILPRLHERSVVIIDDIHRTQEMERAWLEICENALVYTTVDLFRCGICFMDPSLNRQQVALEF